MIHHMKLNPQPFALIETGAKTIELRLYDEKRKTIRPGDTIIFTNTAHPNKHLRTVAKNLHLFPSFEELYKSLPLDKCGYLPQDLPGAAPKDMEIYYSPDQQREYGVVGIELELLGGA